MFYSAETRILMLERRIKVLRARDEMENLRLINALERQVKNMKDR